MPIDVDIKQLDDGDGIEAKLICNFNPHLLLNFNHL